MNGRAILSAFVIFVTFVTVDCRECYTSATSPDSKCPASKPKCCGTRRYGRHNRCAMSCVHFKCETNFDCDGLTCCSGNCSHNKNCLPVTTWGVVGIVVVSLFILLILFRSCQWCRKISKICRRQDTRTTSEEQANNEPPFEVFEFENHGFITPMAPPAYESVVQNTGSRTDGNPPVYNLNLQTIINNSSTNDPASSSNFEINISIRGSALLNNDFPPSYSEISHSGDDDGQPPLYSSSQGGDFEERRLTLSYSDEPPPYSLNEESPNVITTDESSNTTTDPGNITTDPGNITTDPISIDDDSTLGNDNSSFEELQTVSSSIPEADNDQNSHHSSNVYETAPNSCESTDEIVNNEQSCYNVNQDANTTSSDSSNTSSQCDSTVSETTTTNF